MEPQAWGLYATNGRASGYSYGRPYVDKPSFDGLPPGTLEAAHSSVLSAAAIAADWERIEALFDQNWFGPCSCLSGVWGASRDSEAADALDDVSSIETFSLPSLPPTNTEAARQRIHNVLDPLNRSEQLPEQHPNGNGNGTAQLYGLANAPVPEPPFPPIAAKDSTSPLRPAPVPIRFFPAAGKVEGNDGPLPVALPIDTPASAPEPLPQPPSALARLVPGFTPSDSPAEPAGPDATMPLAPQLGTWADRQYRLLDPVPERGELGAVSASASAQASVQSSVSNQRFLASAQRSPDVSVRMAGGAGSAAAAAAGGGSGRSGCGSGGTSGGGGSSSNYASQGQGAPASPGLLEHLVQNAVLANGNGSGAMEETLVDQLEGRRRAGSDSFILTALQQQQLLDQHNLQQQAAANGGYGQAMTATQGDLLGAGPGPTTQQQATGSQHPRHPSAFADMDSEAVQAAAEAVMQEAAWRWRFTRRWQAEQARTGQEHATSAPADQLEEALAYLQATNATTTVSMQILHSGGGAAGAGNGHRGAGPAGPGGASLEGSLILQSLTGTLGAATSTLGGEWPLGAFGSGSGSFTSGPKILGRQASGEMLAASREVAALNRRAALVLQQQMDCEQQAERRVQESLVQGTPWVGQYIPVVQIDEWGSFRFLMLKLRDQTTRGGGALGSAIGPGGERQRIVVRGHNYGSEGQLMEECNREIMALCQKHSVPFEAPTVMGGGVMEWRRDRDRHLHLHSGFVMDRALPMAAVGLAGPGAPNASRPASAMDLLNLAAALARQTFPPTYKITVLS